MPELPDLTLYREHLERRVLGAELRAIHVRGPNLVRTFEPPLSAASGRRVERLSRLGKRLVISLAGELHLALHLMIAGRLHWAEPGRAARGRAPLARFEFGSGVLTLTEAGTRQRAALHLLAGERALAALDAGGIEPLDANLEAFAAALRSEDHTLKRALTDPRLFAGIGNAYSDEILHRARLSPLQRTALLDESGIARLWEATRATLAEWTERLRAECGEGFPEGVTAFRDGFAVHGRHRRPCPDCGAPVQRIRYADRETNYCARCQTGGRLLADRALSRLLRSDWPRTLEELEEGRRPKEHPPGS